MRQIAETRVLARTLIWHASVGRLMLADRTDAYFDITPFDCETANTVFADGVVVCLSGNVAPQEIKYVLTRLRVMSRDVALNPSMICEELTKIKALASVGDASADVVLMELD